MEQISPIQALLQQRTLLQLEYYTEKEAFRKLTEQMGMQRKVKRGDAWFRSFVRISVSRQGVPKTFGRDKLIISIFSWGILSKLF